MRPSSKDIIRALRCSTTVHTEKVDCEDCPCYVREEIPEDLRDLCNGLDSWGSCEPDGIIRQAADRLEELTALVNSAEEALHLADTALTYRLDRVKRRTGLTALPEGLSVAA